MTIIQFHPPPAGTWAMPRSAPHLHQRLARRSWSRLKVAVNGTVLALTTAAAIVVALSAPTVSPVAPPVVAAAVAEVAGAAAPVPAAGAATANQQPNRAGDGAGGRGGGGRGGGAR